MKSELFMFWNKTIINIQSSTHEVEIAVFLFAGSQTIGLTLFYWNISSDLRHIFLSSDLES